MKKLIFSTLALATLTLPFNAFAQEEGERPNPGERMFQEADANGDGRLTKDEFTQTRNDRFGKMDADGNGIVTGEEFREQMKARIEEAPAERKEMLENRPRLKKKVAQRMRKMARGQFGRLDANRDQEITAEEFRIAGERQFRDMDADGDGTVSLVEAQFSMQEMRGGNRKGPKRAPRDRDHRR